MRMFILLAWPQLSISPPREILPPVVCYNVADRAANFIEEVDSQRAQTQIDLALLGIWMCPDAFVAWLRTRESVLARLPKGTIPRIPIERLVAGDSLSRVFAGGVSQLLGAGEFRDDPQAKALRNTLGPSTTVRAQTFLALTDRSNQRLAEIAARTDRGGPDQSMLVEGLLIAWLANRESINKAFLQQPSARGWLDPYPPGALWVGTSPPPALEQLGAEIRRRANSGKGPLDIWYSRFKVE